MNSWQRAIGIASVTTGVVGAAVLGGVTAQRRAVRRYRSSAGDPDTTEPYDALDADRTYSVVADDGVVLHVEEVGDQSAPLTVFFLHGWTLRAGAWHFQRRAFEHRPGTRLVFYDQRSHGRSGRGSPDHATLDDLAADLAAVMATAAPPGDVVLVGHSMGGMTVLAAASRRPELFDRVIGVGLISTSAVGVVPSVWGRMVAGASGPLVRLVSGAATRYPELLERGRSGSREAAWLLTRSFGFARPDVPVELVDYLDEMISGTPVDVIAEFTPALMGLSERDGLVLLRDRPVVIVVGSADRLTPVSQSRALAAALPSAELIIVPGAGHMVTMEAPEPVNDAIARLLDRADGQVDTEANALGTTG